MVPCTAVYARHHRPPSFVRLAGNVPLNGSPVWIGAVRTTKEQPNTLEALEDWEHTSELPPDNETASPCAW